jgi:colicin import membrane protein
MTLLPEEIAAKTFARRFRGYDRAQVTAFLTQVAADYAAAIHRISAVAEDQSFIRKAREELSTALDEVNCQARQAISRVRQEADEDARAVRARAEQAAAQVIRHAEETAAVVTEQAVRLREAARADAEAARARLAETEDRAQRLEETARKRCEELRSDATQRAERTRAAELAITERLRVIDHAVTTLRSRIGVLDQVDQLEELVSTIRTEVRPGWTDDDPVPPVGVPAAG